MRDDCIYRTMHAGYQFKRSRLDRRQQNNSTGANQNMATARALDVRWRLSIPCVMYKKAPAVVIIMPVAARQLIVNLGERKKFLLLI